MKNYLGETIIDISKTKYALYSEKDWVLLWIERYNGIDGSHHQIWLCDQIARIITGTKVIVTLAKWSNGYKEERFDLDTPSPQYLNWVNSIIEEKGEYDSGIAP
jgi:hypothetical protein